MCLFHANVSTLVQQQILKAENIGKIVTTLVTKIPVVLLESLLPVMRQFFHLFLVLEMASKILSMGQHLESRQEFYIMINILCLLISSDICFQKIYEFISHHGLNIHPQHGMYTLIETLMSNMDTNHYADYVYCSPHGQQADCWASGQTLWLQHCCGFLVPSHRWPSRVPNPFVVVTPANTQKVNY